MSLINTEIVPFTATAYLNGEFVEVNSDDLKGKWSIFLFYPGTPYAYRSNVSGFEVLPTGNFRLEDVKMK